MFTNNHTWDHGTLQLVDLVKCILSFPGSVKGIDTWEKYVLYKTIFDWNHNDVEFPFTVNAKWFDFINYLCGWLNTAVAISISIYH